MIVRTYGRRSRNNSLTGNSYSDSESPSSFNDDNGDGGGFENSFSLSQPQEDIYGFHFSSQDSTAHWSFDSDPCNFDSSQDSRQLATLPPRKQNWLEDGGGGELRRAKKARHDKKQVKSLGITRKKVTETATLMETQEVGEMIEHVDEVDFALDGLRKGQPVRIRRASLLSLLTICATLHERRLLRTHGTAKTINNAVLGLSFDDAPSNLAAAALFYILTSDGQEDHLLDSPSSINFVLKLLKPLTADTTKDKVVTFGSKLVTLRKESAIFQDGKGEDSTSAAISVKVEEILVNFKDMKPRDGNNNVVEKPELSPKWIALLTMEKACLSTVSLEENSGVVRKSGGSFKEKLREHGGLDAVFEVTRNCHATMEGWLDQHSSSLESRNNVNLESLVVLLKCLKIMENATFLSNKNQSHLLGTEGELNYKCSPQSITKLILSVIKILSGVSLLISSSKSSEDDKCRDLSNGTAHASEMPSVLDDRVDIIDISSVSSSIECCSMGPSQNSERLSNNQLGFLKSSSESTSMSSDAHLLKMRVSSSRSGSCSGISSNSNNAARVSSNNSWIKMGLGKKSEVSEDTKFELGDDSQDPFAFDEDEFEPSKWDLLAGKHNVSQTQKGKGAIRENEGGSQSLMILSQQESSNMECLRSPSDVSCSSAVDQEKCNALADCLLTAVKVLMNLTNDNTIGCQQIASCGGLETLSSLIARHFPLFSSHLPTFNELKDKSVVETEHQNDRHLNDQELDFLVAILGLLVNLVEKDGRNRLRLASTSVSLPNSEGLEDENRDVIALLCAIFLANQGAGEAAEEGRHSTRDYEDPILQGEKEAEKMIVEAYSALLLAFLSTESKSIRNAIAECLPNHKLAILVPVLERFLEFHLSLNMISTETHTTVLEVIESCRIS